MAKYLVNVKEISYGFVEVEADSMEDAPEKATEAFHNGNVIWPSCEFTTLDVIKQD